MKETIMKRQSKRNMAIYRLYRSNSTGFPVWSCCSSDISNTGTCPSCRHIHTLKINIEKQCFDHQSITLSTVSTCLWTGLARGNHKRRVLRTCTCDICFDFPTGRAAGGVKGGQVAVVGSAVHSIPTSYTAREHGLVTERALIWNKRV